MDKEKAWTDLSVAKNVVMGMLYMPTSFAIADLDTWVKPDIESRRYEDMVRCFENET